MLAYPRNVIYKGETKLRVEYKGADDHQTLTLRNRHFYLNLVIRPET